MSGLNGIIMFSVGRNRRTLNIRHIVSVEYDKDQISFDLRDTQAIEDSVKFSPLAMFTGTITRRVRIPVDGYEHGKQIFEVCEKHFRQRINGVELRINNETDVVLSNDVFLKITKVEQSPTIDGHLSMSIVPVLSISDVEETHREEHSILSIVGEVTTSYKGSRNFISSLYDSVTAYLNTPALMCTMLGVLNLGTFKERD